MKQKSFCGNIFNFYVSASGTSSTGWEISFNYNHAVRLKESVKIIKTSVIDWM